MLLLIRAAETPDPDSQHLPLFEKVGGMEREVREELNRFKDVQTLDMCECAEGSLL